MTNHAEVREISSRDQSWRIRTVRDDARLHDFPGGPVIGQVNPPLVRDHPGKDKSGDWSLISSELDGRSRTARVRTRAKSNMRPVPAPSPDCAGAVAAERERVATAMLAVIRN